MAKATNRTFKVMNIAELTSSIAKMKEIVKMLIRLDYILISGLSRREEGSLMQWVKINRKNPQTLLLLVDKRKNIFGYMNFIPLKSKYFELIKKGKFWDGKITVDKVDNIGIPGTYKLYLLMIAIKKEMQHRGLSYLLIDALQKELESLAKKGVFFDEVCVDAYTPIGEILAKKLGMRKIAYHENRGTIYFKRLSPLKPELWKKRK
jgi:hypothetical protein